MSNKRRPFGEVFEKEPKPLCSLRRLTPEEVAAANLPPDDTVGIFCGDKMIASVDFADLFDEDGNYFYND